MVNFIDLSKMTSTHKKIVFFVLIVYIFVVFVRSIVSLKDEIDKNRDDRSANKLAYDIIMIIISVIYALILGVTIFNL